MRFFHALLVIVAAPCAVGAYTADQQRYIDRFDSLILENVVACFGFQVSTVEERTSLGQDTFNAVDEHVAKAIDYVARFVVAPPPEADLLERIEMLADQVRPAAREYANLIEQGVPLDDARYADTRKMLEPCSELSHLVHARRLWAEENDLPPIKTNP